MCKSQTSRIKHGNKGSPNRSRNQERRKRSKEKAQEKNRRNASKFIRNHSNWKQIKLTYEKEDTIKLYKNHLLYFQEIHFMKNDVKRLKIEGWKIDWTNTNQNKADVPIPEKEFMWEKYYKDKEIH